MIIPVITKAARTLEVLSTNEGPVERLCNMACCMQLPRRDRYVLLPCRCHGTVTGCTCRLRDKHCNKCGRTFIQKGKEWFEIRDPHGEGL